MEAFLSDKKVDLLVISAKQAVDVSKSLHDKTNLKHTVINLPKRVNPLRSINKVTHSLDSLTLRGIELD